MTFIEYTIDCYEKKMVDIYSLVVGGSVCSGTRTSRREFF